MRSIRVGTVSFLNALPLSEGLDRDPGVTLRAEPPARLADLVEQGALDVGLLPVVEAARLGAHAIADIAIAARGDVRSVLLLSRGPLAQVRVVALDPTSRTSVALTRLLFRDEVGREPALIVDTADGDAPAEADARLIIGDRALIHRHQATSGHVTDLAGWWVRRTGLPMVFAIWAGLDPAILARVAPALHRCRTRGLKRLESIAHAGPARGIAVDATLAYLRDCIVYEMGTRERDGLALFLERLRAEGLLAPGAGPHLLAAGLDAA